MKQKYRSKLEEKVHKLIGKKWKYEPFPIDYVQERTYIPDFVYGNYIIEVKGFFRNGDQAKYRAVNRALLLQGKRLLLCFSDEHKPVRKGVGLSYREWCDKCGILCCSVEEVKDFLRDKKVYSIEK